MESDKLIEAMARALCKTAGLNWERETECQQHGWLLSATAALKALRDTLEPVGWVVPDKPGAGGFTMAAFKASEAPLGTPLYALPELKP